MKLAAACAPSYLVGRKLHVALAIGLLSVATTGLARADVFTNVPEASGYTLVYSLNIPDYPDFDATIPYSTDNGASIATGSFTRVGYYLELDTGSGTQWVYTSFDAAPYTTDASKLGVPTPANGELYHYDAAGLLSGQIRNMNVSSNVSGIVSGTGITTGNAEFWSGNYTNANSYNVPGASGSNYDFGDGATAGNHGSMQIHNYGAGQTLWSITHFNRAEQAGLGIGNRSGGGNDADWTFLYNSASYTVKSMQIVVLLGESASWEGGTSSDWGDASNWDTGIVPDAAATYVTFGDQSGSNVVDLLSAGRTVGSLSFTSGASTTIQSTGGYSLTLDNSGIAAGISLLGAHSITAPIVLHSDLSIQGPGTLSMSGGISANNHDVTVGSQSTVNLTGGTLTDAKILNTVAGGTLRIANSTVTMASNSAGVFGIGYGTTGTGTVIVDDGGVLNVGNGGGRTFIGGGPGGGPYGDGVLTINSGGTVNVAAAGAFPNEALYVGGYGGNGTINLNGGTLASARVIHGAHGTRVFNFNGGTLKAEMDASTGDGFLYGMTAVNIQAGGATIDTNGHNILITQVLAHDASLGVTLDGGLTKNGAGTLTLSNTNTLTGAITVNGGTLMLPGGTNTNRLTGNPDIIVNNGATLAFANYNSFGLDTSSMSAVTVNSGGTIRTSGKVIVFNDLTLNDGTVLIDGNDNYGAGWGSLGLGGTTTATGNSVIANDSGGTGTIANASNNTPTLTVNTPAATDTLTISARIGPSGGNTLSLVKTGDGALILNGDNAYTGTTTVTGGTLSVSGGSVVGTTSIITQAGGGLEIANATVTMASSSAGVFGVGYGALGTGTVTVNSGGVLNVGNGGGRTFIGGGPSGGPYGTGILTINTGGEVNVAAAGSFPNESLYLSGYGGSGIINLNGGTLTSARTIKHGSGSGPSTINFDGGTLRAGANINVENSLTSANVLAGGAIFDSNGYTINFYEPLLDGGTGGGLTKIGDGTLYLGGVSTITGLISVDGGTLRLPGGNNSSWLTGNPDIHVNNGATLAFANYNSFGLDTSSMSAVTVNPGGTIRTSGKVVVFNNMTLNDGTVLIDGNDNYGAGWGSLGLGGTTTATGNSVISNDAGGTGTIANASNRTPTFTVNTPSAADTLTVSARIGPSGGNALSVVKNGDGTLILTGSNAYTGGTTVNQGTLEVGNPSLSSSSGNPLGTGSVTLAGGTLRLSGQAALTAPLQTIPVAGFNHDIIVGATETAPEYTASMANWNFYETGLSGGTQGLPADSGATPRTFTSASNPDLSFQFAPYAGNNAVYLDGPGSVTLTLDTPGQYQSLAFLETARSMSWYATLNFSDGSSTNTPTWSDPDWTSNPGVADPALTSYGLRNTNGSFYSNYLWMAGRQILLSPADQAKTLNSITFTTTSATGHQLAMFAVSGATGSSGFTPSQIYGNAVNVTGDATVDVRNSLAATLGPLTIGNHTLSVTGDSGASLKFGTTTLTGDATFDTAADTSLTLGAVGDDGAGYGITKAGAGTMTLNGHSTYGGATVISGGTLRLSGVATDLGNLMPMGDSITYGSLGTNAGYRGPLYNLLTADGYTFDYVGSMTNNSGSLPSDQTHHEGHSGWTVAQVLNGVTPTADGGLGWLTVDPDVITLMIGTNNRGGGVAGVPTAIGQLGDIIDTVTEETPGAALFVAEITPIPGQEAFVDAYNSSLIALVSSKQASGANIYLVDLNTGYPDNALPDNLHPNDTGYNWMAQQWYDAIVAVTGISGSNGLPSTTAVEIAGGAVLDLNGVNQTIASLADSAGSGGSVINSAGTPLVLTINPSSGTTDFSGTISDTGAAGAISLVKTGAGTQILSGANSYSGTTSVNDGTLIVDGSITSDVTVNGGTLGGVGTIDGSVTITAQGVHAPGDSPGVQTIYGDYTVDGTLAMEITGNTPGVGGYDQVLITSPGGTDNYTVTLDPSTSLLDLDFSGLTGSTANDMLWLINNETNGALVDTFSNYLTSGMSVGQYDGRSWYIYYHADFGTGRFGDLYGNDVLLTAVPEPTTLAMLLGLGLVGLLGYLRRQARS